MVAHTRPSPPTKVKIAGKDAVAEMTTKAMHRVKISAVIDDPTAGQPVKLRIRYSSDNFKTSTPLSTEWGPQARREVLYIPVKVNTLYKVRMWTIAKKPGPDQVSKNYTSASFWSNRKPSVELVVPAENSEYPERKEDQTSTVILFDWKFNDPDEPNKQDQKAYRIGYKADTGGGWHYLPASGNQTGHLGKDTFRTLNATTLNANTTYQWMVKAMDPQGTWSDWAQPLSFYVRGVSTPPTLLSPTGGLGTAIVANSSVLFSWQFKDPDPTDKQTQADIRWRVVGTGTAIDTGEEGDAALEVGWFYQYGEGITPGTATQWQIPAGFFSAGFQYEWQVRTYGATPDEGDVLGRVTPSGWSTSGKFVAAVAPGSALVDPPLVEQTDPLGALGCGHHRVFVYDRGGQVLRGEIKPLARVQWGRKRDDIANCLVDTNGFDQDCCVLLGNLQSWVHELVIFRDGVRVFEGPITRITYTSENVEIEAKDVMAYVYRRVIRQGYNDRYRRIDLTPLTPPQPVGRPGGGPYTIIGEQSVVDRAMQITLNALAHQDPNVLPYVTAIRYHDDAKEQRSVPDFAKTAWEEIDDLAATAGLDYTTVGRRIVYWDTHRAIGRLPEMRDGDFSDPVIVTEYGMQTSNYFAVTNGSGVAGVAYPLGHDSSDWSENYGPVEMVASAYGEQEAAVVSTEALTSAERAKLEQALKEQAVRNIAGRWPTPVVVRVPDNSTINPQVNLGINQLIPGVWIPLRATLTCRKLAQWQKLDSLDVEEVGEQEYVRVTMSPAPHGGDDDPDLAGQAETT